MGHRAAIILVALPGLVACSYRAPEPAVTVRDATVQLPAVPGRPGTAYFKLQTNNDPTKLVAVSSPGLGRIELHGSMEMKGMTSMAPLTSDQLVFTPDSPLRFTPGGKHAMIFDMPRTLKPGARVALTFTLQPMQPVTVWANVRTAGDTP